MRSIWHLKQLFKDKLNMWPIVYRSMIMEINHASENFYWLIYKLYNVYLLFMFQLRRKFLHMLIQHWWTGFAGVYRVAVPYWVYGHDCTGHNCTDLNVYTIPNFHGDLDFIVIPLWICYDDLNKCHIPWSGKWEMFFFFKRCRQFPILLLMACLSLAE